jgi:hypothetical protein
MSAESKAPPSPASHPDSGPAKQQDTAPRKSLAQLDRIAFLQIGALIHVKTRWYKQQSRHPSSPMFGAFRGWRDLVVSIAQE